MTTITVTAADTAQAMDKIVERLGEDALILETLKRNGRIEMIATDSAEEIETQAPAASKPSPAADVPSGLNIEIGAASGFTDLFDQQMINTVRDRSNASASTVDHIVGRANEASDKLDIMTELRNIRQMLKGMMITLPEGLDVTLGHAAPVRLHQAGFSSKAIGELHEHMVGLDDEDAITSFINALANRVVHRDAVSVFDSRIVFVIGSSGTGKTTLATKIAAYFKEHGISDRIMLAAAAGPGISASEDIKAYARLLNMRAEQLDIGEVLTAVQETSNRMIIDVNATPEDAITAVREVMQRLGSGKVTAVQAIPGGSSATMIGHQCRLYRKLTPMIALTKLDECEAMPAELSALGLEGSGVGLLTGTKSIVGGIAIATMPILAQYLKENIAR
jgi:flagellar biosynthesis GTPase FlhF